MLNPWFLLGVALAIGGAFGGGFLYGKHVESAEAAQARETAISAAITDHNKNTLIDMEAAYESGLAKGKARTAAATNRESFNVALSAAPRRPDTCDMPKLAYDRLLDAVNLANADEKPAVVVPTGMSKPAAALKPPSR